MTDVPKVPGQTGPREPDRRQDVPSGKEFEELMKPDKLRVDVEQQKKRKRPEKSEEEKMTERKQQAKQQPVKEPKPFQETYKTKRSEMKPTEKVEKTEKSAEVHPAEEIAEEEEVSSVEEPQGKEAVKKEKGVAMPSDKPTSGIPTAEKPAEGAVIPPAAPVTPEAPPAEAKPAAQDPTKIKAPEKSAGAEEKPVTREAPAAPQAPAAPAAQPAAALPTLQPYVQLDSQTLALFERAIGVMSIMNSSGITETTIRLTSPQFKNSAFFNTQIVIREYSSAPKSYTVQILGTPRAVERAQANLSLLTNAFAKAEYNFTVARLETGLLPSHRATEKKKKPQEEKEEQ